MKPPALPHVSEYIAEEMEARGWDRDRLAWEMTTYSYGINRLCLDLLFDVGPVDANCRLGKEVAETLGHAFGVDGDIFLRLEQAYLERLPKAGEEQ